MNWWRSWRARRRHRKAIVRWLERPDGSTAKDLIESLEYEPVVEI